MATQAIGRLILASSVLLSGHAMLFAAPVGAQPVDAQPGQPAGETPSPSQAPRPTVPSASPSPQPSASPLSQPSASPSPQPSAAPSMVGDYAAQARAALERGDALKAGYLLMEGYRNHGDAWALYLAGFAFQRARRKELAIDAWGKYLCVGPRADRRRHVRLKIRDLQPRKAPPPCLGPRPKDTLGPRPEKKNVGPGSKGRAFQRPKSAVATSPSGKPRLAKRSWMRSTRAPKRPAKAAGLADEVVGARWNFELETGLRFGDESFGLIWAPGFWLDLDPKLGVGLFAPLFVGDRPGAGASIGIEPRVHFRLQDGMKAELAMALHSNDGYADSSYSFGGGVNFGDVLSVRVKHERFETAYYYEDSMDLSATYVDVAFTGKTGKTITGIEAGLALLILVLSAGG